MPTLNRIGQDAVVTRHRPVRRPRRFAGPWTRCEFDGLKGTGRAASRSQEVILNHGPPAKRPPSAFTERGAIVTVKR